MLMNGPKLSTSWRNSSVDRPMCNGFRLMTHRWRWRHLLLAPHRLAFFMGAVMLGTSALWWTGLLLARALQWQLSPVVPVSLMHALLMSLAYMPLFFCGFLYTAGPKWLKLPAIGARALLPELLTLMTGWAVAWIGMHWQSRLAVLGMGLVTLGWAALSLRFARMVWCSQVSDKTHPKLVSTACLIGVAVMFWLVVSLALNSTPLLRMGIQMGIWWFLAPVFAVVSHRMIQELRWLEVWVEALLAMLLLGLGLRWGHIQNLKIRLLAMLYGGFAWFGIALALNAISHGLMAASWDSTSLGLAPFHAMTMGYLGSTMYTMVTRVSSGHGGRKEPADNTAWLLYFVLQVAVILRISAAIIDTYSQTLTLAAAVAWCVVMSSWAVRYGVWFGTPRPDGRDG